MTTKNQFNSDIRLSISFTASLPMTPKEWNELDDTFQILKRIQAGQGTPKEVERFANEFNDGQRKYVAAAVDTTDFVNRLVCTLMREGVVAVMQDDAGLKSVKNVVAKVI